MKIVKLTLPLEAYAKSLFKNTIGNDLRGHREGKIVFLNKDIADTFAKNTADKLSFHTASIYKI